MKLLAASEEGALGSFSTRQQPTHRAVTIPRPPGNIGPALD